MRLQAKACNRAALGALKNKKQKEHELAEAKSLTFCRAGVVFLCSAVQAYIERLSETMLDSIFQHQVSKETLGARFRYYFSEELIRELLDTRDSGKRAEKILVLFDPDNYHADVWSHNESFNDELDSSIFNKKFNSPSFNEVKKFFNRFGFSDYSSVLTKQLKGKTEINALNFIVEQRNLIAHGDNNAQNFTPDDIEQRVKQIKDFCRATDKLIADWSRDQGFPIRTLT
jgi:hypothetical protein